MSPRGETWLWLVQRLSAMVLAPLVMVHLATIVYAVEGGLSAQEILARTQGSLFWGTLYTLFVAAAAVHGPIGLRTVIREMTSWRGSSLDLAMIAFAAGLALMGLAAVRAVT
ncbi:MAG: succinate dehydrogenase [Kiloniellales bacterium]